MATTEQRLAEYEDLFRKAQQYDPNKFKNEFEKSYGEATNYNKDLIEQQAKALGEVQAIAPTYRERYMNSLITDPTAQMALIAQARQAPITSYGTAANLLTARGQRYQDILNKALGGYQTAAEQANIARENAWRLYQDALQQDQFNRQLARSGGGNGTQATNIADLLNTPYGGNQEVPQEQVVPQQKVPSYWQTLTNAAQWQPKNQTLANLYNRLTNTVGKYAYENPWNIAFPFITPITEGIKSGKKIANLLKKKK